MFFFVMIVLSEIFCVLIGFVTKQNDQIIKIMNNGFLIADLKLSYRLEKNDGLFENFTQKGRISFLQCNVLNLFFNLN